MFLLFKKKVMQNNVMKMIYVNIKSPEIQNFEIFGIRERERERD